MRFEGKVSLVTGSSRGIGRCVALKLAHEGSDVVVNYLEHKKKADEVVDSIKAMGRKVIEIKTDVSDFSQVDQMVKHTLNTLGQIDILVNNAGIYKDKTLKKMGKETWDEVLKVNLDGVFNCTRAAINHMKERKTGRIINISSFVGQTGNVGQANYAASKAGVIGLTKTIARELANYNITVNAIAPGFVDTDMTRILPKDILESILKRIPLGRLATPDEIAHAVLFLASDEASYITGQVINVNGGIYI
jgi:3-oxoacyl-[acyl-carrier protein] reductase